MSIINILVSNKDILKHEKKRAPHRLKFHTEITVQKSVEDWLNQNTNDWILKNPPNGYYPHGEEIMYGLEFTCDIDAMAFKLRWM